jgi:hypothetical protein
MFGKVMKRSRYQTRVRRVGFIDNAAGHQLPLCLDFPLTGRI